MNYAEACVATAPRATLCIDALLIADAREIEASGGMEGFADLVRDDLQDGGPSGPDEARAMYRAQCLGDPRDRTAAAVFDCWERPTCDAFAACVTEQRRKQPR